LVDLEKVVAEGLKSFIEVGEALAEIRDRRLYRSEHTTFDAYLRSKWGFDRTRASRLIAGARAAMALPVGNIGPKSERQVRPLAKLPANVRAEVWESAVRKARGGQPTSSQVEAAAREASPAAPDRQVSIAMLYVPLAIAQLKKIPHDDAKRTEALRQVGEWITHELAQGGFHA